MSERQAEGNKVWIPCRVFPGMFSDELVVEVSGESFFVESGSVRETRPGYGEVEVSIIDIDGQRWAILPTCYKDPVALVE